MIDVVAALIRDGERFLICQRPKSKASPLLWELPGGKIEPGETMKDALSRECREELGITLEVGDVFGDTVCAYAEITIHLFVFAAIITEGTPQLREHNALRWITVAEIPQYNLCPADEAIIGGLLNNVY